MKRVLKKQSGFTILELALAMAFISFLLLAIGMVTVQVSRIYQKGMTIKLVNGTGRELVDEFTRTILSSRYDTYEKQDENRREHFEYTYPGQYYEEMPDYLKRQFNPEGSADKNRVPFFGAFCTGSYSYIWNTGYALALPNNDEYNQYKAKLEADGNEVYGPGSFRLLRVNDASREICINYAKANDLNDNDNANDKHGNTFTLSSSLSNPTELLSEADNNLVLYDLIFFKPALHEGTGSALFSASFILGTTSGFVNINETGAYCKNSPDVLNSEFTYCSLNKYNFAARATGGTLL